MSSFSWNHHQLHSKVAKDQTYVRRMLLNALNRGLHVHRRCDGMPLLPNAFLAKHRLPRIANCLYFHCLEVPFIRVTNIRYSIRVY